MKNFKEEIENSGMSFTEGGSYEAKNKENIYLNLAECSEEERNEIIDIIGFNLWVTFQFLLFDNKLKIWNQCKKENELLKNKTQVNFQEFKEIMGATETQEDRYNRLCKEATELQSLNISERMDIANNIFKDFSLLKKNKSILHEQLFSAMEMYLKKCIETKRQIKGL